MLWHRRYCSMIKFGPGGGLGLESEAHCHRLHRLLDEILRELAAWQELGDWETDQLRKDDHIKTGVRDLVMAITGEEIAFRGRRHS